MFKLFAARSSPVIVKGEESDVLLTNIEPNTVEESQEPLDDGPATLEECRPSRNRRLDWIGQILRRPKYVLILGIIFVFLFGAMFFLSDMLRWSRKHRTCSTPACVLAAAELLSSISPPSEKIDLCTNFRDFVCGGWDSRNELRSDQASVSRRSVLHDATQGLLRKILESQGPHVSTTGDLDLQAEKRAFAKIQQAYRCCMDEGRIAEKGLRPLLEIMAGIQRVTPRRGANVVRNTAKPMPEARGAEKREVDDVEKDYTEVVKYMMTHGVETFISFRTKIDDKNPKENSLLVRPVYRYGLLSKDSYSDQALVGKYSLVIEDVLSQVLKDSVLGDQLLQDSGNPEGRYLDAELVQSVIAFEAQLFEAIPPLQELFDVRRYYNVYSLEDTQSLLPQISLESLIANQTGNVLPQKLVITSPSYVRALSEALQAANEATVQAYLAWRTVQVHAVNIEHEAMRPYLEFQNSLQGKDPKASEERWKVCVRHVNKGLGWMLGYFWVRWHLPSDTRSFGNHVVSAIRQEYLDQLKTIEWMSADARNLAAEKLQGMTQEIAYPTRNPNLSNVAEVEALYGRVGISEVDFFHNVISFAQAKNYGRFAKLAKSSEDREWDRRVDTIDAYYSPAGNQIVVPGGITQPPVYYGPRLPKYLTYGAFGALMGHEISHAFDSMGRFFDAKGNMTDWWDEYTVKLFDEQSQCFIHQYNQFSVTEPNGKSLSLNGTITLDENLADARGLQAAFKAWRKQETLHPDKALVGLERFSKEQIFFLSYGKFWCSKMKAEAMRNYVRSNTHAPDFARIIGTTANSQEFRSAFGCPIKKSTCEMR